MNSQDLDHQRSHILTEFIVSASHEFRTPLSNINTALHILRRVEEEQERNKRLGIIQDQVDRIAALVTKMLLVTRLDSEESFHFIPVDAADLVYEAEVSLSRQIEARRVQIEHILSDELPACPGDNRYLHLAFVELLDNALKFSPSGSVIQIRTAHITDYIVIEIIDKGAGISEADKPRIFERFYRGNGSNQHYGFGLGLSIARLIVEQHGGTIEFESELDKGSIFRVYLPYQQIAEAVH